MAALTRVSVSVCAITLFLGSSHAQAKTFKTLHSFKGGSDGESPEAALTYVSGVLYGTTTGVPSGPGTIFAINPSTGSYQVLYHFKGAPDGANPFGRLLYVNGIFFGVTGYGGSSQSCEGGCGTLFSFDPSTGNETTLYSFSGPPDGAGPSGPLLNRNGVIYGTTYSGGARKNCTPAAGCGTVYSFNLSKKHETLLYSFKGKPDGQNPESGLLYLGQKFYGTTLFGGTESCEAIGSKLNCGTIFSFSLKSPTPVVLKNFIATSDGAIPAGELAAAGGVVYGTTIGGGPALGGTVYGLNIASQAFTLIHSFTSSEGWLPGAGALYVKDGLYGTTTAGGDVSKCENAGCGAIYKVDTKSGAEKTLYKFRGGAGGGGPGAPLIENDGTFYGTTCGSGCSTLYPGYGTVFELTP